ncbi:enoyl-CoA hydratase [Rhodococcus koreensis]
MNAAPSSELLVDKSESILILTLNRPESRNALSSELIAELHTQISAADSDPDVSVVILTGADPAFCAGVDLRIIGADGGMQNMEDSIGPAGHPWPPISKPVIGAINGAAVTGGLELALGCDILIASERARFADTHARVGVMPLWGMTARLPEAVGSHFARRMSLSGNFVNAQTALVRGLVTEVVPHAELMSTARELALDIASNNQNAVRTLLGSYRRAQDLVVAPQIDVEAETGEAWLSSEAAEQVAMDAQAVIARGRAQLN